MREEPARREINTQCFVDLLLATVHVGLTFYFQRPLGRQQAFPPHPNTLNLIAVMCLVII